MDRCGCITIELIQRGKASTITSLCAKHIAEAELDQSLPAKEEVAGSNPTSDT